MSLIILHAQVTVDVELWDLAAAGGMGARVGSAEVALDLADFEPSAGRGATLELTGPDGQVRKPTLLEVFCGLSCNYRMAAY